MTNLNIKAGRINNLTDARFFAAANVKYIGFDFRTENKNQLTIEDALEIKNWLSGPEYILEFSECNYDKIFEYCSKLNTNLIQIPYSASYQNLNDYKLFLAVENDLNAEQTHNNFVENYVITINSKESLEKFYSHFPNAIYHLNLSLNEQIDIFKKYPKINLELIGKEEEEIGIKSYDEINDLLDWMDDQNSY